MASLPDSKLLAELNAKIHEYDKNNEIAKHPYVVMMATFARTVLQSGVKSGVDFGIATGLGAAGVKSGLAIGFGAASITVAPIAAALAPWIAAVTLGLKVSKVNGLIDLRDDVDPKKGSTLGYSCKCGKCHKNLSYMVEKEHERAFRIAVYTTVVGLVVLPFKALHSTVKSFMKGRPKEIASEELVAAGRIGCTVAMATVCLLVGENTKENLCKVVSIIGAKDGARVLKELM